MIYIAIECPSSSSAVLPCCKKTFYFNVAILLTFIFSATLLRPVYLWYFDPLRKFNGPFLASFSDLWRYSYTRNRRNEVPAIKFHAKYGDIVRFGPNKLSFASPRALKEIYGVNKGFVKV